LYYFVVNVIYKNMSKFLNIFNLKSKVAVITGGAVVLGYAFASWLWNVGNSIAICDINNILILL